MVRFISFVSWLPFTTRCRDRKVAGSRSSMISSKGREPRHRSFERAVRGLIAQLLQGDRWIIYLFLALRIKPLDYLPNCRKPLGYHALRLSVWGEICRSGYETLVTAVEPTDLWSIIQAAFRRNIAQSSLHLTPDWDLTSSRQGEI